MSMVALKDRKDDGARVTADAVRIGKDIVEILTTGMYVSPVTVYREYIQNAADAIDAARARKLFRPGERGQVSISFDRDARCTIVRDNGTGIVAEDALPLLLAVGASPK